MKVIFATFFSFSRIARSDHSRVVVYGYSWKSDIFVHNPCSAGRTYNFNAFVRFWVSAGWSDTGIC